jgi:general stress protein YciG
MTAEWRRDGVAKRKNPAAVALAKRRLKTMTAEERQEVARQGGKASRSKLTPEQRSESARKAGLAGGRGRKKAK